MRLFFLQNGTVILTVEDDMTLEKLESLDDLTSENMTDEDLENDELLRDLMRDLDCDTTGGKR